MITVSFILNGQPVKVDAGSSDMLLDVLRETLHLTGTKKGCGKGECGACTVIMDGRAVNSCMIPIARVSGSRIETIDGIGDPENLHPLQEAFIEKGAIQCGFCTPGMIMSAKALLDRNPDPSDAEIKEAISGNYCRCTGYKKIVEAIRTAARYMRRNGGGCHEEL